MKTVRLYNEESLKEAFEAGKKIGKETPFLPDADDFIYNQWLLKHGRQDGYIISEDNFITVQTNSQIRTINGTKPLTVEAIVEAVSDVSGMDQEKIYNHESRDPAVLRNRQLVCYLSYYHVSDNLQDIADRVGKRHYSSMHNSVRRARNYIETDRNMKHNLELIYMMLKNRGYNTEFFVYSPTSIYNRNARSTYIPEVQSQTKIN